MAHVLIMPRRGNTVESCVIGEWKVKENDTVSVETTVCTVETDKALIEIAAGAAGTVLKILWKAGDDVPVLKPIMVIGDKGENWEEALSAVGGTSLPTPTPSSSTPNSQPSQPPNPPVAQKTRHIDISKRAKKLADLEAVDVRNLAGTGPLWRIIERDVINAIASRPPLTASAKEELRRQIAEGTNPQLSGTGSGFGGRLNREDIISGRAAEKPADMPNVNEYTDSPIKGIRKIIANQMMTSHNTTAPFTLNASVSALVLQKLRTRFKASAPELGLNKITVNDLVLFAASRVLPLYPFMNAHKLGDNLRTFNVVHLGVAVSTLRGLMVPVLKDAQNLSLAQISSGAKSLAEMCRDGTIPPDDLHGSTITVTNLGNTGIESFTPVINIPEVAILGVCGIQPKPVETAPGIYEIQPCIGFSLTIDHAVIDGAPAAEFLKAFCHAIRDIDIWIAK